MDARSRCIDISTKLQVAHAASDTPELKALHASLAAGLDEQADALGLDEDDLSQIEHAGTAARGGNPKDVTED